MACQRASTPSSIDGHRASGRRLPKHSEEMREINHLKGRHAKMMFDSGAPMAIGQDGRPLLSPGFGTSGHIPRDDMKKAT